MIPILRSIFFFKWLGSTNNWDSVGWFGNLAIHHQKDVLCTKTCCKEWDFLPPISLNWWPSPDFLVAKKKGIKIDMYALRWLSDDLKSQKFVDGRNSLNSHMFLVLKKTPPEWTSHMDQKGKGLLDFDVQYQCKLCKVVSRHWFYDDLHRYAITFWYVRLYVYIIYTYIYIHVYPKLGMFKIPQRHGWLFIKSHTVHNRFA